MPPLETTKAPEPTDASSSPSDRLSLSLTDDGRIDVPSRESTRTKLKKALSDPTLSIRLGITPVAPSTPVFDATICGVLYDAVGRLLALGVMRAGYPADQVASMLFTDEEKSALAAPTGKVLDKYLGASTMKYQDEIMLAMALGSVLTAKLGRLQKPGTVIDAADRFKPAASASNDLPTEDQPS